MSSRVASRRPFRRKVQGKEISLAEAPLATHSGNVIDLMEALRASIDARGAKAARFEGAQGTKARRLGRSGTQIGSTMRCMSSTRKTSSGCLVFLRPKYAR